MSVHLSRQIEHLKKVILALGTLVEESLDGSTQAVQDRDAQAARRIVQDDARIDQMEIDVEEECLHTLALHQPVAFDLRFVVSVLKINNDLERIGDLSTNIAEQAIFLSNEDKLDELPFDLVGMTRLARTMLKRSLDALVNIDPQLADSVRAMDDQVDAIHRDMYANVVTAMRQSPHHIEQLIHMANISRCLERIADHTTNIAEDVIYMARGDIPRHRQTPAR